MDEAKNYKQSHNKIRFKCKKCGRCCENSKIRLSPYDILRLCKRLSIPTMEFLKKYAYPIYDKENKDLLTCMLKTSPRCLFLAEEGCVVYNDRPYACRVYPLAVDPFYNGNLFEKKFYILEECIGFDTKNKVSLAEFKEDQKVDDAELYDPWVIFKIKIINSDCANTEEFYSRFFNVCYDFDNVFFKQALTDNNIQWPDNIGGRYKIIIKLANKILLA